MLSRFLRQPLVHFFLIGALLFVAFDLVGSEPPAPPAERVAVSVQDARWLSDQFEATWRRPPSPDELTALMDDFVREEIYVREALSLGLDQGDTVVRRRLRQKMEFLTEAGAQAANPDDATLIAHYQEYADRFDVAPRIAFTQILLPQGDPAAVAEILAALDAGADPATLGERTLLPQVIPLSPVQAVDGGFGRGVFDRIADLDPGLWSGPIPSGYGEHLVRLDELEAGALPPFETVRERVELDWRATMAARLREERFDELAAQYQIEVPDPAEVLAQ